MTTMNRLVVEYSGWPDYEMRGVRVQEIFPSSQTPICFCCGAQYLPKNTNPEKVGKQGIQVFLGTNIPEKDDPAFSVRHIKTKNGDLTVSYRHRW